jgi:hypothetical protein
MKRFYLYEGNDSLGRDETDSFDTLKEAVSRAKLTIENAKYTLLPTSYGYVVHVIDRKTDQFLYTIDLND